MAPNRESAEGLAEDLNSCPGLHYPAWIAFARKVLAARRTLGKDPDIDPTEPSG